MCIHGNPFSSYSSNPMKKHSETGTHTLYYYMAATDDKDDDDDDDEAQILCKEKGREELELGACSPAKNKRHLS